MIRLPWKRLFSKEEFDEKQSRFIEEPFRLWDNKIDGIPFINFENMYEWRQAEVEHFAQNL
jgi:hypothetical protein